MLKRIVVNKHIIRANMKTGAAEPPISVHRSNHRVVRAKRVSTLGAATLVYDPENPLRCGATVWLETHGEVIVHGDDGEVTYL
jgi:hypothetical protein